MNYRIWLMLMVAYSMLSTGIISFGQEPSSNLQNNYVSVAGLWRCTPETALELESITLKATILIRQYVFSGWSVQGCFMWEEGFCDYWDVSNFQFNDTTKQVTFSDSDGSLFIGVYDESKQQIRGMVYSSQGDTLVPEDKLDFQRINDVSPERLFTPRSPLKDGSIRYVYKTPKDIVGIPGESIGKFVNDSLAFTHFIADVINQKYGRLESLLIAKDGKLVLEEYFFDYKSNQLHNVFSCTKSIVSLLTGIALGENNINDMDITLLELFPQFEQLKMNKKEKITLKHVLTMSTGLKRVDIHKFKNTSVLLDSIFSQPLESEPGTEFKYHWNSPNILGGLIFLLTGQCVNTYAKENFFDPLGIKCYKWGDDFGVPDCHSNLHLLPRDMVKIGMLILNRGKWQEKQIVPESWILQSTLPQIRESKFFDYGYLWWLRSSKNNSWWENTSKEVEKDMIVALGFGGQYIFIINDLNLVIVITSSDYNESNGRSFEKIPMVKEKVVPLFE